MNVDNPSYFGLYVLADAAWGDPLVMVRLAASAGVRVVQLRCKSWPIEELLELGQRCRGLVPRLIINDRVEVARALGVEVHLGQGDGPDPTDVPFGRSTHDIQEVRAAAGAQYLGFGPIFPTRSKADALTPRGPARLAEAVRASSRPIVAIGGIGPENLAEVQETGAAGWAVAGAIWASADPAGALRQLQRVALR